MSWVSECNVNSIIEEFQSLCEIGDLTNDQYNSFCERVATTLERNPVLRSSEFPGEFRFLKDDCDIEAFEDSLQALYDFCDANAIWMGV